MKHFDLRRVVPVIISGLILGSLFANIYCSDNVGEMGVFNYNFMEKMHSVNLDFGKLFSYVVQERMKTWLIIFLLSFSSFYLLLYYFYLVGFGFLLGLTCSTMVMIYGMKGTFYFLFLCLIPQLFYLASILAGISNSALFVKSRRKGSRVLLLVVLSVLILALGAFLETIFNITFVNNYYKL